MKEFMGEDFLLHTETARYLYHEHAKKMPIFDYHCHLPTHEVLDNKQYDNLTQIWLYGDHYKWRAMRSNGVPEHFVTGDAGDYEKFEKWAETVPYTLRNPLYHWTHLELKKPFGIRTLLSPATAKDVFDQTKEMLAQDAFRAQGIMKTWNVKGVCTTDDPTDTLDAHRAIKESDCDVVVLPTFRPDKAMTFATVADLTAWMGKLEAAADMSIRTYDDYVAALTKRHDAFHEVGCRLSDHGLTAICFEPYTESEVKDIFAKLRGGNDVDALAKRKFQTALMVLFGKLDAARGWTMQLHMGALRNNSSRLFKQLGPDTGFDSIGDWTFAEDLSRFLDALDRDDTLPKTILYNLNPRDNEVLATMIGNFQDGSIPGKVQFGSGWWFLDQKDGMIKQMNALSNLGLLSRFVGMLTDSRSFLSYSRHEYFRRILCALLGDDVEAGEIPNDRALLGRMVEDISYNNAKKYFGIPLPE